MDIAVIFTCFNRRDKTLSCIEELEKQAEKIKVSLKFYICDDGSTDGTYHAIKQMLPTAEVVESNGNLYWCRGMYTAMKRARAKKHDFYLMINDDTVFEPNALQFMIESYKKIGRPCGIVGTMKSLSGESITYGGQRYIHKWKIGRSEIVKPSNEPIKCDIANWNCFLVSQEIIDNVGIVDPKYEHGLGDFDYSLMMKEKGYSIYTSVGYIGRVDRNPSTGTYMDNKISRKERIQKLLSRKGRPVKSEFYFYAKHYGLLGFFYCLYLYARIYLEIIL